MKNIHILPTDKPSRGIVCFNGVNFCIEKGLINYPKELYPKAQGYDIYITNSEEIKEEDWFIYKNEIIHRDKDKIDSMWVDAVKNGKKIILTTDQDLIKDGIQEIPKEFLEWFVKNPSCEFVDVEKDYVDLSDLGHYVQYTNYKIIIPQEEPKQETLEEVAETELYKTINKIINGGKDLPKGTTVSRGQAVDYAFNIALEITKWQAKRMYSEEDMKKMYKAGYQKGVTGSPIQNNIEIPSKEWFEQFKKK